MSLVAGQSPAPPLPAETGSDAAMRAALAALSRLVAEARGQMLAARIGATLPNGLTQVLAGSRQLAVALPQPLPPGTPVQLSLTPAGAVQISTVSKPVAVAPRAPLPAPAVTNLSPNPGRTFVPVTDSTTEPSAAASPGPPGAPVRQPPVPAASTPPPAAPAVRTDAPPQAPSIQAAPAAAPAALARPTPAVAPPATTSPAPAPTAPLQSPPAPAGSPPVSAPVETDTPPQPAPPPPNSPSATAARAYAVLQSAPPASHAAAPPASATPDPAATERLDLVDRQQNAAPLLARLVAVAARRDLPAEVRQAALAVLATRVPLDRGAPAGEALRTALTAASGDSSRATGEDLPDALTELRAALGRLIAGGAALRPPTPRQSHTPSSPPPLLGDPPEAGVPQAPLPADGDRVELARHLIADTDGALARHRLLGLPSQPTDARPGQPAPGPELRIEVPMLLAGETGMVQFVLEREARRLQDKRVRGWRMRFAMHFTATGEVGADVGLVGSQAQVALWAGRPEIAESLEAMSGELAPALARHGLTLAGFQLRRGALHHGARTPGRLVDGAR